MSSRIIMANLLAIPLFSGLAINMARSDELDRLVMLCAARPVCASALPHLDFARWALNIGATIFSSSARSNELAEPLKLCAANPNCTHDLPDATGTVRFKISKASSVVLIRCAANHECWRVFPRGGSGTISNLTTLFAGK